MIGERIESRSRLPWGALTLLTVGLGLVAAAPAYGVAWALIAAFPFAWAAALWALGRERPFVATFQADAIEVKDPHAVVPYASIRDVRVGGRSPDPAGFRKSVRSIQVRHEGGLLRIPSRLSVPSYEVYRFLAGHMPPQVGREVNPALREYLDRQERYYGPENVWTYRAATDRPRPEGSPGVRAFALGLALTGVVWAIVGFSGASAKEWGVGGILCAVLGGLLFLASFAEGMNPNRMIKNWKKASIVVSPQGMALVQGEIEGEIHWSELIEIRYGARPRSFALSHAHAINGVKLRVKGADVVIADLYDRPLHMIHARILSCSGKDAPAAPEL